MTIALEGPAAPLALTGPPPRDPRELVSGETFTKLVRYVTTHQEVHRFYAEREVGQMLVFLKAICQNPGVRLVPDLSVDPAWHAFLMHTQDYTSFEAEHNNGERLHHVPYIDADITSGAAMMRTIPLLHKTGFKVDAEFWETGASCCPPNPPPPCSDGD
ncbi:MAG: hypothetical protein HOY79_18970 [Streptomyces sp.]|nr:hypothetical protein [Streptomyces sp.]